VDIEMEKSPIDGNSAEPTQVELANKLLEEKQTSFPPIISGYRYRPQAQAMRTIGAVQTLAVWRHKGIGPPYYLCGSNIVYEGSELLEWLKSHRIDPNSGAV